jgi:hypothetical protein
MIKFTSPEKRQYVLTQVDSDGNEKVIHNYNLVYNPGSNKYDILIKFVEDMCNTVGKECEGWYINFLTEYIEKQDIQIIKNNIQLNVRQNLGGGLGLCAVFGKDFGNILIGKAKIRRQFFHTILRLNTHI